MPGLALTDHGCLFGAWAFHKLASKAGLKPIIGMEAYVAPGDRRNRSKAGQGERAYYHLVLLARDMEGYQNLVKLSSIGYTEGFYHRPRVDREVLAAHSGGIVVSSACLAGEVARNLMADNWEGARGSRRLVRQPLPGPLLPGGPGPRLRRTGRAQRQDLQAGRGDGAPRHRHERCPLPGGGGPRRPRRAPVHRPREGPKRPEPHALRPGPLLQERPGDRRALPGSSPTCSRTHSRSPTR